MMTILPKTCLGKWNYGLAITFAMLFLISVVFVVFLCPVEPSRLWLVGFISDLAAMLVCGISAFVTGLLSIKNKRERSVLVYSSLIFLLLGILFLGVFCCGSPKHVSEEEIIERFLINNGKTQGYYDIISPQMSLNDESEDNVLYYFQQEGLNALVTRLFSNNEQPTRMNIPSSPDKGYVIDYDGKFESYFEEGGGDWAQLREENPKAGAMVYISTPAYDSRTGLVMIYCGWSGDSFLGEGDILVFKYIFGKLIPINKLLLWIS